MLKKISLLVLASVFLASGVFAQTVYENACESLEGLRWYYKGGKLTLDANGRKGNCIRFEVLPDSKFHPGILFPFVNLEPFAQYEVSVWTKGTATLFYVRWVQPDIYGKKHLPIVAVKSSSSWINTKLKFRAIGKGGRFWPMLNCGETNSILIDDVSITKVEDASVYLGAQQAILDGPASTEAEKDGARRILGQAEYLNTGKIVILEAIASKNHYEFMLIGNYKAGEASRMPMLTDSEKKAKKAKYLEATANYEKVILTGGNKKTAVQKIADIGVLLEGLGL